MTPPFAEDLTLDVPLPAAPDITIDEGLAAAYLAICGDQLAATLSTPASIALTGRAERLANPALVISLSIGQSTVATRRVIANLQYRDLTLLRPVHVGETVRTVVTPTAASWTSKGRERAKVLLHMDLTTASGDTIAAYQRLALIPVRDAARLVERAVPEPSEPMPLDDFASSVPTSWTVPAARAAAPVVGDVLADPLADTVSSARELVRLTQNLAATHRDARVGGQRLVYGGHTVGLAQASLSRMLPDLVTVLAWRSCDHLAPVMEDDLLSFTTRIDGLAPLTGSAGSLADVTVTATAHRPDGEVAVLDWHPVLLLGGAA